MCTGPKKVTVHKGREERQGRRKVAASQTTKLIDGLILYMFRVFTKQQYTLDNASFFVHTRSIVTQRIVDFKSMQGFPKAWSQITTFFILDWTPKMKSVCFIAPASSRCVTQSQWLSLRKGGTLTLKKKTSSVLSEQEQSFIFLYQNYFVWAFYSIWHLWFLVWYLFAKNRTM